MDNILNVECSLSSYSGVPINKIMFEAFLKNEQGFPHSVIVWNNNYTFKNTYLEKLPNCRLIINWGTDTSNLCELPSKIKAVTTKGYCTQSVSDYILKQFFAFNKNPKVSIGFVGFGEIGQATAQRLLPYASNIKFCTPSKKFFGNKFHQSNLQEIVKQDVIIICADTNQTLLTSALITSEIKNPKLIINVSRESVVSPEFILKLIRSQRLNHYVSDNFEKYDTFNHELCVFTGHKAYKSDISKKNKNEIFQFYYQRHLMEQENKQIFIARHGETEWNAEGRMQGQLDSPVTQNGRAQVENMSKFLAARSIAAIYSSPLGRCQETATQMSELLQVPFTTIPEMAEMDFGDFQGQLKTAVEGHPFFEDRKPDKLRTPYPNGESYLDVHRRIVTPIRKALAASPIGNLVFVGHESLNRIIPAVLTDQISLEEAVTHRQKNNQIVEIDLATGNRIVHGI